MRALRQNTLFVQLEPSFPKVSQALFQVSAQRSLSRAEFTFYGRNFCYIKNNLEENQKTNQPNTINLALGILLRVPEIMLNMPDIQRFQA